LITPTHCADFVLDDDGTYRGHAQSNLARARYIREIRSLFDSCRGICGVYPVPLHTITGHVNCDVSWNIDSIARPAKGDSGRWHISYTSRDKGDENDYRSDIELDADHNLWLARDVTEWPGTRSESNREFRRVGGSELPWSITHRTTSENHVEASRMQFHDMPQTERERLKHEVEQIAGKGPIEPNQSLTHLLVALAIIVPVGGTSLLWLTRNGACSDSAMSQAI
jgi:hypothetical protein